MLLKVLSFSSAILYLTLLAAAFHKLMFETRLRFIVKLAWTLLLVFLPLIGVLLFHILVKTDKDDIPLYIPSLWQRAARAFLVSLVMVLIVVAVMFIVSKENSNSPEPSRPKKEIIAVNN